MARRLNKHEVELLRKLADYRMLTVTQIAVLSGKSERSARRWKDHLVEDGLVEALAACASRGHGRPEGVFGVSQEGIEALRSEGVLLKAVRFEQVGGQALVHQDGHQILLNWCRIHLVHLTRVFPRLVCNFLSSNSPFDLDRDSAGPIVRDFVMVPRDTKPDKRLSFVPDGVFILTDSETAKSLLFILEVDMGSESLDSSESERATIIKKIQTYRSYFACEQYRRYEEAWQVKLNGFRVLFVTSTGSRMTSLCRVIQSMPPSDFIWVTSQESLFAEGISGNIWARGGKQGVVRQSILGGLAMKVPIPELAVS